MTKKLSQFGLFGGEVPVETEKAKPKKAPHSLGYIKETMGEQQENEYWVGISSIQKSIRRGDVDLTEKLFRLISHPMFLKRIHKRLHTVLFEEIGPADLGVVRRLDELFRQDDADANVDLLLEASLLMAKSVKCRDAEHLASMGYYVTVEWQQQWMDKFKATCPYPVDLEMFQEATKMYEVVNDGGSRAKWFAGMEAAVKGTPIEDVVSFCHRAQRLGCESVADYTAILLRLGWTPNRIEPCVVPPHKMIGQFPNYGIDKHNRVGLLALKVLEKQTGIDLDTHLAAIIFYREGVVIDRQAIHKVDWLEPRVFFESMRLGGLDYSQAAFDRIKVKLDELRWWAYAKKMSGAD